MASKTGLALAGAAALAFIALGGCASQQSGAGGPTPHLAGYHANGACNGMKGMKCKASYKKGYSHSHMSHHK